MSSGQNLDPTEDDDALHWAGDEARGQAAPRLRGFDAQRAPLDAVADPEAQEADPVPPRPRTGTGLLVTTGIFAALFLGYTVGWILSAQLLFYPGLDLLGEIMWQFSEFIAMVAPALWFAAVLTLTPEGTRHRAVRRIGGLALGTGILIPWPVIFYWIGSAS